VNERTVAAEGRPSLPDVEPPSHYRHGSEVLEPLIQGERLFVVGAEYSLETGVVDFFDGVSEAG
jgi:hypothetical protein